ncbi:MAG: WbqC family protein [Rikenellaceae bacterium]
MVIVPSLYLGNLAYYKTLFENKCYKIEAFEHYNKQSFRSRVNILGANGRLALSIPIVKSENSKQLMKDVKIEYVMQWQKQHWRSIVSAYKSSPYFEEYEEMFAPHYHKKETFLFDFNQNLHATVLECFEGRFSKGDVTTTFQTSELMAENGDFSLCEELSSKKKEFCNGSFSPYYQVFNEKFDFEDNLSIIDYLFCEGTSNIVNYFNND